MRLEFLYDPTKRYELRSDEVTQASGAPRFEVDDRADAIAVWTRSLSFTVGKKGFDGFRELRAGGRTVPVARGSFYAIDEAGIRYDSANATGTTEVEERGPLGVVLKFTGMCSSKDGVEVLRYLLRVSVDAYSSELRFLHTMVFACNTKLFRFREIGLETGVDPEGAAFQLRQPSPSERILNGKPVPAEGACFHQYSQAAAVAVRDFRERAPLEISASPGTGVRLLLWPDMIDYAPWPAVGVKHADLAKLPFAHQGPLLDFNVPPVYQKLATPHSAGYFRAGIAMGNAMGLARSHEFALLFGQNLENRCQAYLARPHVVASGEWMANSCAVGDLKMLPRREPDDRTTLGRCETVLDRNFDWEMRKLAPVELGKWVWGAAHSQWIAHANYWSSWRLFRNTHHGSPKGYWYLFARSADPKYLAFARRNSEYVADVGMCHYADTDLRRVNYYGKVAGRVCDYKGYVPWHSGSRSGYNTYADFLLSWWYLTGHPRAKDTIGEMMDLYVRGRRGGAGSGRAGASRMEAGCSLYAHTRDGRLLSYLHASLEAPRQRQDPLGFIPCGKEFGAWLPLYHSLTANPVAEEMLKRWAYADVKQPWWYDFDGKTWQPNWHVQAYAYEVVRDPTLLGPALGRLGRGYLDGTFLQPGHPEDGHLAAGNTAWNWPQQKALPFMWALAEAGERAEPVYAKETFLLVGLDKSWRTWAVFGGTRTGAFRVRLRGHRQVKGEAELRVIAAGGEVIHSCALPAFEWKRLSLSNPPIHPETAVLEVDPKGTAGPYFLQGRGGGGTLSLMAPFTDLPKEVYDARHASRLFFAQTADLSGRFPQYESLRDYGHWLAQCYGHRRLYFRVPQEGARIECHGVNTNFGRYAFAIENVTGEAILKEAGFNGTKMHAVRLKADAIGKLRGQLAAFAPSCGMPRSILILGEDIPPFVALSPDRYFVPE